MQDKATMNNLYRISVSELSTRIRKHCVKMTNRANASHIGSCLSMTDLLSVLYGRILCLDPEQPDWPDRDRFVLSKGHGCAALYAVLAERGFFPLSWLDSYSLDGSCLAGHATHSVPGVEVSTGSLGHGLSIATGMAVAAKQDNKSYRIFCILGDGECDEGSIWEATLFAAHHKLDNLITIIDYNKLQSLGRVKEVIDLDPLSDKWQAFKWSVREIDGHNLATIEETMKSVPFESGKPSCIIAHTVKGKGVSFMEDKLIWHYKAPLNENFDIALKELDGE